MATPSDLDAIHPRFHTVGSALMRVNLNNSHSGNMSCRDPQNAQRFWITASGAPCGDLTPADLVAVRFDDLRGEGSVRPSSEANTHRRVLELPGVNACVHCHAIASTLLGFETAEQPAFLSPIVLPESEPMEYLFQPVDVWGAGLVGAVPVGVFQSTVGSPEMEQRIPVYLSRAPLTLVKGHGPFACGPSLEHCLHYLSVLEHSAIVVMALRRRGVDTVALQKAVRCADTQEAVCAYSPRRMDDLERPLAPTTGADVRSEFNAWLAYNFDLGLGAFGTGSMSRKLSTDEMIFCPMSAAPQGVEAPLQRLSLHSRLPEAADVRIHRLIYARTPFKTCMVTASPLANAEAMAVLAAAEGTDALIPKTGPRTPPAGGHPVVAPIDAESAYYKVRLPVASSQALAVEAGADRVPGLLQAGNGCCLIAGSGVIAAGEERLGQAAYRVSLAERMARFRLEVAINHHLLGTPPPAAFE